MTAYLPYRYWQSIIAAHQWIQCGQLRFFPAPCMTPLLAALARLYLAPVKGHSATARRRKNGVNMERSL